MSFVEVIMQAFIVVLLQPVFGVDAAWYTFPIGALLSLVIIVVYAYVGKRPGKMDLLTFIKVPSDFGVPEKDRLDLTVHSMDDVINISERVMDFCHEHDVDSKCSMVAGLCIEEMAGNSVRYGFSKRGGQSINIRVIYKSGSLTLRLRDNCKLFDPKHYAEVFTPEDPTSNIGIRMLMRMTKEMDYQNVIGLNVLTMKI